MSKERARRRELRQEQARIERERRERVRLRQQHRRRLVSTLLRPARAIGHFVASLWQPLSGGQQGRLARRRRRRVTTVAVIAVLVNIAVAATFADTQLSLAVAALTAAALPVLARLLFSGR
ncbi:MAG: hypothetical protein EB027_01245 [Actinobacteria bacterium]|nr:hypothetical protein [Actinomycetota bacterium]